MRNFLSVSSLLFVFSIAGCNSADKEPADLSAEGYQYKGAADQLLDTPATARAGTLADRFDQIQGRM